MFTLEQIQTKDGLLHQGITAIPLNAKRAFVWVHGLTGSFYSNTEMVTTLAQQGTEQGIAFASFNTRGHDMITGMKIIDANAPKGYRHGIAGAGYEQFTDAIYDIEAVISFFEQKGIDKVILVGHSTGANKVCYYQAETHDNRVVGVVLASPVSDRYGQIQDYVQLEEDLRIMRQLVEEGKGESLVVGKMFFPLTPKRYVSLMTPGPEDQFGYGEAPPDLPYVQKITEPLFVLLGEEDEYLDRPATEVLGVFAGVSKSSHFASLLVPQGLHSYTGKEAVVAKHIVDWAALL